MTAHKVWEYRHEPDIYSSWLSSALRQPNGNTLVNFGARVSPDHPTMLVEARPDGTVAWELLARLRGSRTTRYRAYPLRSLLGEEPVRPTTIGNR
jgi:hypothetical protein